MSMMNMFYIVLLLSVSASSQRSGDEISSPLSISFRPPANSVHIGRPLVVRCQLMASDEKGPKDSASMSQLSMFLYCPVVQSGAFCFQNCKSVCAGHDPNDCPYDEDLQTVKCTQVITHDGQVSYEYAIESLKPSWIKSIGNQAGFYCKLGSHKTVEVNLIESKEVFTERMNTTTTKTTTTASAQKLHTKSSTAAPKMATVTSQVIPTAGTGRIFNYTRNYKSAAFLKEFLIVGAVVIVGISIIVNLFCCIRCVLIRQYSNSKGRAHMQHLLCMSEEIQNARIVNRFRKRKNGYVASDLVSQTGDRLTHADNRHCMDQNDQPLYTGREIYASPGSQHLTMSDNNSNIIATASGHFHFSQDGKGAFLPYVVVPRMALSEGRSSKTNSVLLTTNINGQLKQDTGSTYPASHYQQHEPSIAAFQQPLVMQPGSEGPGSAYGSNPDQSNNENYQPSSSGISTLQNSQSVNMKENTQNPIMNGLIGVTYATQAVHPSIAEHSPQVMVPVILGPPISQYEVASRVLHSNECALQGRLMNISKQQNGENLNMPEGKTTNEKEPPVENQP